MDSFNRITDQDQIRKILDANMRSIPNTIYIPGIFIKSKNCIYEGVRVLSASTDYIKNIRTYSFTNGDSNYQTLIVSCDLEDIGYILVNRG